jgi:hypothetical protein
MNMGNGKTDRPRDRATDIWKMTWREIKIKEQRDENIKRHTNTVGEAERIRKNGVFTRLYFLLKL